MLDVDDLPYIVMEYVEGETLGALVADGSGGCRKQNVPDVMIAFMHDIIVGK